MIAYWYYIIAIAISLVVVPLGVMLSKKSNKVFLNVLKAFSLVVGFVFLFRYMLGTDAIRDIIALDGTPFATKPHWDRHTAP